MKGLVFDIKKFAIHDGPGIRTTVFLKGCPLRCRWCHNPESISVHPQVAYSPERCAGCWSCVDLCPRGCHYLEDGKHFFDRSNCVECGQCAEVCLWDALEMVGRMKTVEDVLAEVVKDRRFYETSGGGITLSGGEPMIQKNFTEALLLAVKQKGLHTCLDTSGFAPFERYSNLLPLVDIFLYDIKETDPEKHREFTGVDNRLIMQNLFKIDTSGANIILRCPVIPGLNDRDEHLYMIGDIADNCDNVIEVNLMPFHPYGASMSKSIGTDYKLEQLEPAGEEQVHQWLEKVQSHTSVPVKRG